MFKGCKVVKLIGKVMLRGLAVGSGGSMFSTGSCAIPVTCKNPRASNVNLEYAAGLVSTFFLYQFPPLLHRYRAILGSR